MLLQELVGTMIHYNILAGGDKSSAKIIALSTADARAWWATEAERIGTNWRSLISLHLAICDRLQATSSSWGSS
jgi:hypothetical protein